MIFLFAAIIKVGGAGSGNWGDHVQLQGQWLLQKDDAHALDQAA